MVLFWRKKLKISFNGVIAKLDIATVEQQYVAIFFNKGGEICISDGKPYIQMCQE